jgi:hypothetical protein
VATGLFGHGHEYEYGHASLALELLSSPEAIERVLGEIRARSTG